MSAGDSRSGPCRWIPVRAVWSARGSVPKSEDYKIAHSASITEPNKFQPATTEIARARQRAGMRAHQQILSVSPHADDHDALGSNRRPT